MNRLNRRPRQDAEPSSPRHQSRHTSQVKRPGERPEGAKLARPDNEPARPELAALPRGMRVQDAFVRRYLSLEPRQQQDAQAAATQMLQRVSLPISTERVLDGWTAHAKEAAGRYRTSGQNNRDDDARHLAFATIWTAAVRNGGTIATLEEAARSFKAPTPSQREDDLPAVRSGLAAQAAKLTARVQNAFSDRPTHAPPPALPTTRSESRAATRERDPERQTSAEMKRLLDYALASISPAGRAHLIDVALTTHAEINMTPQDARLAFASSYAELREHGPTRPERLQAATALAAIATVRPVTEEVNSIRLLSAPIRVQLEAEVRAYLSQMPTSPQSLKTLEVVYEKKAIRAALTRVPEDTREAMLAALRVSMQRARMSGMGTDWHQLAANFEA